MPGLNYLRDTSPMLWKRSNRNNVEVFSGGEGGARHRIGFSSQVVLDGIARGGTARRNAEFAIDRVEVGMDGTMTNHQSFGHLEIGQPLRHSTQNLDLAFSEPTELFSRSSTGQGWLF